MASISFNGMDDPNPYADDAYNQNPYTQAAQAQQHPTSASPNPMGDPNDYYGSRGRAVAGWYQQYLGRNYDEQGYRGWVNGRMTLADIENAIKNSPEARAYASRSQAPPTSGSVGSGGGIFSDPATHAWEQAVGAGANRLLQPLPNPYFQPYVDYMRNYFKQLQQPGYTSAEQDLMQTQALDPLERQRQAARQQVTERFAKSGVQGGLVERAMQDVDRQFNQMRTTTQGNFASQQIQDNRNRQQQAAQVGAALSQAQQAAATNDEGRMMQALALLFQIPQYADTRLSLANQSLQSLNPASLIAAMTSINSANQNQGNTNTNNNNALWSQIGSLLAGLF